ncbi:MAG: hypothetical protein PF439_10135 [Helicobacteraceae bacterium]|jgi:hypothetical protein|nr:hypothetical protein [Helicobacteraceae bacterium]
MSLTIILLVAILLSILFHFVGVYAGAKKTVWVMLLLVWAGSFSIALQEISPKGYEDVEKIKGKDAGLDRLIEESLPKISVYEMLVIKKSELALKKQ